MKKAKIVFALFLAVCTLFSFSSCGIISKFLNDKIERPKLEEIPPEHDHDHSSPDSDSSALETVPEEEEQLSYTVVLESSYSIENIEPIYDTMYGNMMSLGVSILESANGSIRYLVDYSGNIKATLPGSGNWNYCSVCQNITDHMDFVHPESFTVTEQPSGHGGSSNKIYYNQKNGELFTVDFGEYIRQPNISLSVVELAIERPATQEEYDWYGYDKGYDFTGKYGIVVNSKLVVPCEYEMSEQYNGGVCALRKDGKWGFFNDEGQQILDFEYDPGSTERYDRNNTIQNVPYGASYGYIAVNKDGKWAYSDTEGNLVTDFEFEKALPVHNGVAWVKQEGVWKVIQFNDYSTEFSEEIARSYLEEYLSSPNYSSVVITSKYTQKSLYLADGYCFTVDCVISSQYGVFDAQYDCIVFSDGTVLNY